MTTETLQTTIDSLDDLLEREREALLTGDVDGVARLHDEKGRLVDALNKFDTQEALDLRELDEKVRRNQLLLDTALDGIRSVARRLAAIRRVKQSLETYDESGRKSSVDMGVTRSVEKRA